MAYRIGIVYKDKYTGKHLPSAHYTQCYAWLELVIWSLKQSDAMIISPYKHKYFYCYHAWFMVVRKMCRYINICRWTI